MFSFPWKIPSFIDSLRISRHSHDETRVPNPPKRFTRAATRLTPSQMMMCLGRTFLEAFWDVLSPLDLIIISSFLLLPPASSQNQISVGTAGSQPRAPSSRSQWALPDLNGERQSSVGTAGRQLREPDLSGHCGTSLAIIASASARCHIWNVR